MTMMNENIRQDAASLAHMRLSHIWSTPEAGVKVVFFERD
jgi:hypothetical protein